MSRRRGAASALVLIAASLLLCSCLPAAQQQATTRLAGETMGSVWTVQIAGPLKVGSEPLRANIQAEFDRSSALLSTYDSASDLSRFNSDDSGQWQALDPGLFRVLEYALSLGAISRGAYDVTVAPVVDLWGFGPSPSRRDPPTPREIAKALQTVGWHRVQIDRARGRARKPPGVRVDLSSLGKGEGVDGVARYLDGLGIDNYLIDLSGKLRAAGRNARGLAWRVAVEVPGADDPAGRIRALPAAVTLNEESVATAGSYRRYFASHGQHYSHIIDPIAGVPVAHATQSATVLAATGLEADAIATLLMVMPPTAARSLAEELQLAALLVTRESGEDRIWASAAWRARNTAL